MIWINCLRWASTHPRVAQPHRYAPFNLLTATNLLALEVLS
jgi:hypothetical protein